MFLSGSDYGIQSDHLLTIKQLKQQKSLSGFMGTRGILGEGADDTEVPAQDPEPLAETNPNLKKATPLRAGSSW